MSIRSSSGPEMRLTIGLAQPAGEQRQRPRGVTVPAAAAGIHGAHQHEMRLGYARRRRLPGRSLPCRPQVAGASTSSVSLPEFRQLIQEQHAAGGPGRSHPARGVEPPPVRPAMPRSCGEGCGRAGGAPAGTPASSRPMTEWICVTSSASSPRHIRQDRRQPRRASMLLPEPGGPTSSTLCAPAAATSSARLACT